MRACTGFFFFSSRRRHTRFDCDWSSDVCSSDLGTGPLSSSSAWPLLAAWAAFGLFTILCSAAVALNADRSEEHTSELQSQSNLVCRLLLEKKKPRTSLSAFHTPQRSSGRSHTLP